MASTTSSSTYDVEEIGHFLSATDTKESIRKTGAYVMKDALTGHRVDKFINQKKLPLKKSGLRLLYMAQLL